MPRKSTLGLLKFATYRDVADAITVRAETIISRWERSVRDELPRADRLTLSQLRDEMPDVLTALSDALAADDGKGIHLDRLMRASDGHGRERFHQSYDVNELMMEYALLRPILLDEVATYLARDLHPGESVAVNMGLDAALRHSVTQFATHQQDRLRQTTEAQSKYLSFLSHDLRGGLNGVLLMVEVLKRELAGEPRFGESIEDLDAMRRSIMDTVGTMDRFLHAELFRAGKVTPRTSTVDLRMVLSDVLAQFTYLARDKGVQLRVEIPTGVAVVTDKDLLALIVQNLISNAVKYTPGGTDVRVAVAPAAGGGAEVRVEDHGPGIAPPHLARLFEPFTRGDTHGQPGVGLGLSIAKQAAELIGADLRVESTVGVGSTFVLALP
jgi:signal transduction histidine kinase